MISKRLIMDPEVIFFDGTYKTNVQRFSLYIMLAQDNNGTGRRVDFAFIQHEDKGSVRWALMRFIEAVGGVSSTRVLFVDKDFSEICAVSQLMPDVDVLLCQFHVIKHLKKEISQLVVDVGTKAALLSLFKTILHSYTQVEYERNRDALLEASPEDFAGYLTRNWFSCQGMWCCAFRRHLLTLGNNTTNRIESFNSQVKTEIRKRRGIPPSLPETVGILLQIAQRKDADASQKSFRNTSSVIINTVLSEMTPAGCLYNDAGFKLLQSQMVKMKNKRFRFYDGGSLSNITVADVDSGKCYALSSGPCNVLECDCTFSCIYAGLPCCHILYANQQRGLPCFDPAVVPDRWRRIADFKASICSAGQFNNSPAEDDSIEYSSTEEDNGMVLNQETKYADFYPVCKELASWVSELGMGEYWEKRRFVCDLLQKWRSGVTYENTSVQVEMDGFDCGASVPKSDKALVGAPVGAVDSFFSSESKTAKRTSAAAETVHHFQQQRALVKKSSKVSRSKAKKSRSGTSDYGQPSGQDYGNLLKPAALISDRENHRPATPIVCKKAVTVEVSPHKTEPVLIRRIPHGGVAVVAGKTTSIVNTCSIDSQFMILLAFSQWNKGLVNKITCATLKQCIDEQSKGNFNASKQLWLRHIQKKTPVKKGNGVVDLEGNLYDNFLLHFEEDFSMIATVTCSNPNCPKPTREVIRKAFEIRKLPTSQTNLSDQVFSEVYGRDGGACATRLSQESNTDDTDIATKGFAYDSTDNCWRCKGQKKLGGTTFGYEGLSKCMLPPFALNNDADWRLSPDWADSLPFQIVVGNDNFLLAGVVLHHPGHFAALILRDNTWYYYNGLHGSGFMQQISFTEMKKLDFNFANACYLIQSPA